MRNIVQPQYTGYAGIFWRFVAPFCVAIIFFFVILQIDEISGVYYAPITISLLLTGLFFIACLICVASIKPDNIMTLIVSLMLIAGLIALRGTLLYYWSKDYYVYLRNWVYILRDLPIFATEGCALSTRVGNYNLPYMHILLIISQIDFPSLFLIKVVSIFFDIVLAYYVMKLVSLKTTSINVKLLAFIGTLAIPTVVLNSSMWAQSDSIYSTFAMAFLYYAITGKSKPAFASFGLALAFKMQAVFIAPMLILFTVIRRIRVKDIWIFPAVFFGTLVPSVVAGMPISSALSIYFEQFGYFDALTKNVTNIWRLVGLVDQQQFIAAGLFLAAVATTGFLYFLYIHREKIFKNYDLILIAYLFAVMLPFLLPKMHDRFFYMADVLSLVVFIYNKKLWYVPLVTIFASYHAYAFFLMDVELINPVYISIALGVVILLMFKHLINRLYAPCDKQKTQTDFT